MRGTLRLRPVAEQPVAHAPHVLDEGPARARLTELAPEPRRVRVERPRARRRLVLPDLVEQLAFREDALGLPREPQQQLVLLLREQDSYAVDAHVARAGVDADG